MLTEWHPEALRELVGERPGPCVSIYLTAAGGREAHQGQVRLRRLLARVEEELAATLAPAATAELLAPVHALLADPQAWKRGAAGTLALFAAPGFFRRLELAPAASDEVVVGSRFHLRPLLGLLTAPPRFYVLALSRNRVRLVEATPEGTRRLSLGDLEGGFDEAMGYRQFYSGLQVHSAGARGGGATRRPAVVHGHGDSDEEKLEEDLRHWCRRIAEAVAARGLDRQAPRVLATTRDHAARYLAASRDPLLLPDAVEGNPDRLDDDELVARARPVVEGALARQRQEALSSWRELLGSGRASGDLGAVLRLARQKRVQTLFLPAGAELWGSYEAASGHLELHPERRQGDEELLARAALETLGGGGDVYELAQVGALDGAPVAALLRR
jgi:hypothetical protein